jgi:hypothetical protein
MTRSKTIVGVLTVAVCGASVGFTQLPSDVRVTDLRCEYLADPLGTDVAQPRLSWKLQSQWRGQRQTAYLPIDKQKAATESPASVYRADYVKFLRNEDNYAVFEVESGTYEFVSELPPGIVADRARSTSDGR